MTQDGYQSPNHPDNIVNSRKEEVAKKGMPPTFRSFLKSYTGYFYLCSIVQMLATCVYLAAKGAGVFILGDYIPSPNLGFLY